MRKFKKVIAALAATSACALLGVGAYAADTSMRSAAYSDYDFYFSFRSDADEEGCCRTDPEVKEDSLNYAGVHCEGGNIASNMPVYFSVLTGVGKTEVTTPVTATYSKGYYRTYYKTSYAEGYEYILQGMGGGSFIKDITIHGYWNP